MNSNLKELLQKVDRGGAAVFFINRRSIKCFQGFKHHHWQTSVSKTQATVIMDA